MNRAAELAIANHCRLAAETLNPIFRTRFPLHAEILTVNSGYE